VKRLALIALLCAACDDEGPPDALPPSGTTPTIASVRWLAAGGCRLGQPSDYTIIVEATDGDTPAGLLQYRGSLPTCSPPTWSTMSATEIISCPSAMLYDGTVEVRDPEGHSATRTFSIIPCSSSGVP
jgi:hypothetical protein